MQESGRRASGNRVSTVLGRRLGGELQRLRVAVGKTQREAAEVLSATQTKIVKMESGCVPVRDPDILALCAFYGADEPRVISQLLELAKTDRERRKVKGWWNDGPVPGAASYIAMEDAAVRNRQWQLALVPGLFQTAEYIRAMGVADSLWEDLDQVEAVVSTRARRQQRLYGDNPLIMHAVIWEAALRQAVGGAEVMRRQLNHLCELAELSNIHIQVLPFRAGGHSGVGGPFNILSFGEDEAMDVVHMDTPRSEIWIEDAERSSVYVEMFNSLSRSALAPYDSMQLMHSIGKGMSE
ncbi:MULTISPECIES: helix-turn-helix transcriptional regulator [unclassified Streptomyces]|uniref:helix-turn-helix domain-containing protein n=1 Tax=unclassified Streptomyces TaxID=2593676 RepID=UPI002E2B328A|nr:helix-turn-helix transcriptional regulator [Streptomyces sp. NBC_01423]WSX91981.1 helix-turn-helix domain-containing protein [Streptomyces sp. NBC_00891]WSY06458.1 helix-turn-helix domain-containing protein [Streptomyces sp. NBC_00890]WSZ08082.1 helix-turn-helix domain-containing protein [Streptomyces sp. NBC_00869]WSZ24418.1 helix-turn-helix domain-containing protein [Streptomyces sp. NBC_00870]